MPEVELDYNYLVQYNTENGTDYEMLDEKYYSFERDFVIEAGADEAAVPLSLKIEQLLQDKGYGIYYIPLSVNSRTPEEDVYVDKSHFILLLDIRKPGTGDLTVPQENKEEKSLWIYLKRQQSVR